MMNDLHSGKAVNIAIYRCALGFIFLALLLVSCDRKRFYEHYTIIDNGIWDTYDKVRFEVTITDTVARYHFYLNIRNDVNYPYANLFLFLKTIFPDGRIARDTIECTLAAPD